MMVGWCRVGGMGGSVGWREGGGGRGMGWVCEGCGGGGVGGREGRCDVLRWGGQCGELDGGEV